MTKCKHFY